MSTSIELKTRITDEEYLQAREQYVAQVRDESLIASQVLQEQLQDSDSRDAAPTFVP